MSADQARSIKFRFRRNRPYEPCPPRSRNSTSFGRPGTEPTRPRGTLDDIERNLCHIAGMALHNPCLRPPTACLSGIWPNSRILSSPSRQLVTRHDIGGIVQIPDILL